MTQCDRYNEYIWATGLTQKLPENLFIEPQRRREHREKRGDCVSTRQIEFALARFFAPSL